jgi:hypothetical protein
MSENLLDETRGIGARKPDFAMQRFGQICPCQRARSRHVGMSPNVNQCPIFTLSDCDHAANLNIPPQ